MNASCEAAVERRYEACLHALDELEAHAAHDPDLAAALAPWCRVCAAAADLLESALEIIAREEERIARDVAAGER